MRNGYKMTKFGEIPEDWKDAVFNDSVKFSGGSQPPRSTFLFEPADGYVRLIQTRDYRTEKYKTYIPSSLAKKTCTKDDVMIGRYGPPIFQIFRGLEGAYNVALIKAIPDIKNLHKDYLYYYISQHKVWAFVENLSQRSGGQTGVDLEKLKQYPFPLPPKEEQQRIVEVLSTVDEKIEVIEAQITQTLDLKRGLMQRLLTKGIGHREFKSSPLGEIPEEWEVVLLDDIARRGSGHTPNKNFPEYYNGEIKWVSLADSNRLDNRWISNTAKTITHAGIDNSSAVLHPNGTVLLSRDAGIGKSAVMAESMAVSQHFITWTVTECLNNWFLYYYLQLNKPLFERIAIGSTIKTIGLPFFKKFQVPLPPIQEQDQIATILFTLDDKIDLLKEKAQGYRDLKKGLMQQLLTGKIRVNQTNAQYESTQSRRLQPIIEGE